MIRKFIFLTTLFLLAFGGGKAWAEDESWSANSTEPTPGSTVETTTSIQLTYSSATWRSVEIAGPKYYYNVNSKATNGGGNWTSSNHAVPTGGMYFKITPSASGVFTLNFVKYKGGTKDFVIQKANESFVENATVTMSGSTCGWRSGNYGYQLPSTSSDTEGTAVFNVTSGTDYYILCSDFKDWGLVGYTFSPASTTTITAAFNSTDYAGKTLYAYNWGAFNVTLTSSNSQDLTVASDDTDNTLSTLSGTNITSGQNLTITSGQNLTITPTGAEGVETLTLSTADGALTTLTIDYKTGRVSYPHNWIFNTAWTNFDNEIGSGTPYWTKTGNRYYNAAEYPASTSLLVGGPGTQAVTQTYGLNFTAPVNRIWAQSVAGGTSYLAVGDGGTITISNVPAGYTVGLEVFKTTGSPTMRISSTEKNNHSFMYNDGSSIINDYAITGSQAKPQLIYVTAVEAGDITLKVSSQFVYFNSISVANVNALDRVTGNTYEVYSPGQLATQTVSSIPGITMEYGTSAENQYVRTISGQEQDGYFAYCVDGNGYTHAFPNTGVPTNGTFYKFTVSSPGTLSVTGVATVFLESDKNNVVLVKSDGSTTDSRTTAYNNCSTKTTLTFSDLEAGTYYLYGQGATTWNLQSFTFTPNNKFKTIMVSDMKYSPNVNSNGLNANAGGLDRTLGGFSFAFTGGDGIKYNNGINNDINLLIRVKDENTGKITITPQNSAGTGTITITKVVLTTNAGYTGSVKANDGSDVTIDKVSSYTFDGLNGSTFTLEGVSGEVFIEGFTIYYTEADGATLSTAKVTPTITWSKSVDDVTTTDGYTSPKVTTNPANFDISIASSNTGVASVVDNNWASGVVSLTGTNGTATFTASSTANDFYNAATNATYTVAMTAGGTGKKWDFTTLNVKETVTDDTGWNGGSGWTVNGEYYKNAFTCDSKYTSADDYSSYAPTSTQLAGLKFARKGSALSSGNIRLYSSYLTYNNTYVVIGVPVSAGQSVIVTFSDGTYTFDNATVDGDESATSITAGSTTSTVTLIATADGYVNLVNSSKAKLYSIEVKDEARQALTMRDTSNTYEKNVGTDPSNPSTDNHFSHRVHVTPAGALTYADWTEDRLHISSSDNTILDVSKCWVSSSEFTDASVNFYFYNIVPKKAGKATLTITFDGNDNYKPYSYESLVYTVYGAGSFQVQVEDQQIQRGQLSQITPIITNEEGHPIGIRQMTDGSGRYTTYELEEEDGNYNYPDYSQYFEFNYTVASTGTGTNWEQIQVDTDTGAVTTEDPSGSPTAEPGASRNVTVTATPKTDYTSAFTSAGAQSTTATLSIIPKAAEPQIDLYWDAECTETHRITPTYNPQTESWYISNATKTDGVWSFTSGTFADGVPNGRMIYAKVKNEGDSIWFSYAQNADAQTIPANPTLNKDKRIFEYRKGIPLYVDESFENGTSYVTLNIVATTWDASTRKRNLNGSVARMKFTLVDDGDRRPAKPTYDPVSPDNDNPSDNKDGRKMMNTSENVVAYGEGASKGVTGNNNLVFGKFSTETVYKTEQLINERTVTYRLDNVPVVSTEVAKRRFTSVQVKTIADDATYGYGEYISEQTYTEYWYLYDTDLTLTPNTNFYINVNKTQAAPSYYVTWYNKKKAAKQEVDSYAGKISYSIGNTTADRNGATEATVDESTGIVTAGATPGWVRVKITYSGGEQHGGVSGEPQYVSTTDVSTATYYVYISDPTQEEPMITPPTRNFTTTQTYRIQAPADWYVWYTTDGTEPTESNHAGTIENGKFHDGEVSETATIKAVAYNPSSTSQTSRVVSETYTKVTPLPDPVFDPDGVATPYRYNTSTLTVQIACAYAGSVIYYTVDGTDPVIGATNTYKYSGLSKVVISGNVAIKAVAYDPERDIYSNVVRSAYIYSDVMSNPFFQISNDGGMTWYGFPQVGEALTQNGTEWYDGQSWTVTPITQIRIIDPNPVAGTIYYTLDGTTTPSADVTSQVYMDGYPFTVNKTTLGQAITVLEDASSDVSTANFLIDSASGIDVWEAVAETTPEGKMTEEAGFVISTDENLSVANTGSRVNLNSISKTDADYGKASKTYAQKYITATFGGFDRQDWNDMTIADRSIGAPIDGVGEFSLKSKDNAKDENLENYNHIYSYKTEADKKNTGSVTAATTHEKTFRVPATGGFVRFEPEKDGDLTIWCLQQGALLYEDDKYFIPNVLRIRPVYMVDEQGNSLKVKTVNGVPQLWSSARLSENWATIHATAASNSWKNSRFIGPKSDNYDTEGEDYVQYVRVSDGAIYNTVTADDNHIIITKLSDIPDGADKTKYYKKLVNKGPNRTETAAIYQLYKADLDKNHVNIGDPIKPFAIHTGTTISMNDAQLVDDSDDGTGYVLASGGYAKYTFEVKAGKTYFFLGQGTKIGIRGFQFIPTETVLLRPELTLKTDAASASSISVKDGSVMSLESAVSAYDGRTVNVTVQRTFKANTWTSLVLPFSVSVSQIEKVFGDFTDIVLFDDVRAINNSSDSEIHLLRHWYKMVVAGTPLLIKPTKGSDIENPKFEGVQLETSKIDEIKSSNGYYKMTGTFVNAENALKKWDYYINSAGNFSYMTGDQATVKGTRSWLKVLPANPNPSRLLSVTFSDFDDEGSTTGIINVEMSEASNNGQPALRGVYNLKGQKVSDGSLENLPKGIYIVNGKKKVVE